jgi:alpha,alpha-trehalase
VPDLHQRVMSLDMCFKPWPGCGLIVPAMTSVGSGILAIGGSGRLLLSCPEPLLPHDGELNVALELHEGESLNFALQYSSLGDAVPDVDSQSRVQQALLRTLHAWQEGQQTPSLTPAPGVAGPSFRRVLHALSYQPTGATVAAAPISLPETHPRPNSTMSGTKS